MSTHTQYLNIYNYIRSFINSFNYWYIVLSWSKTHPLLILVTHPCMPAGWYTPDMTIHSQGALSWRCLVPLLYCHVLKRGLQGEWGLLFSYVNVQDSATSQWCIFCKFYITIEVHVKNIHVYTSAQAWFKLIFFFRM